VADLPLPGGVALPYREEEQSHHNGAAGGRSPYEQLYHAHYSRLRRLCRLLLGDGHEAEDVTQEVFLQLLRRWQADDLPLASAAWLTSVAVNACRRRRRSRWWQWWHAANEAFVEGDVSSDGTPEEDAVRRQQRSRIVNAFYRLSIRQQEVFLLRQVEGWSTQEVADMLGLATGSVKLHLFRANRAFQKALGGRR